MQSAPELGHVFCPVYHLLSWLFRAIVERGGNFVRFLSESAKKEEFLLYFTVLIGVLEYIPFKGEGASSPICSLTWRRGFLPMQKGSGAGEPPLASTSHLGVRTVCCVGVGQSHTVSLDDTGYHILSPPKFSITLTRFPCSSKAVEKENSDSQTL